MKTFSPSRLADHFSDYLFKTYGSSNRKHIQRVSTWIGLLALGVDKLGVDMRVRQRQIVFERKGKRYKARFSHKIKPNGGIEFVEVEKAKGSPDIGVVRTISSLAEAAAFYDKPRL